MSNSKISALTSATTVAGTEVLPIVQSSATVKLAISDLNPGLSTILASKGGTGLTSYAAGDIVYYASGTALSKLAIGAANTVLTSSGTAPQWSTNLNIGSLTATSISNSGNLTFTGTGNRITGLMDGASVTNRLLFQTSTTNSQTTFGIIPNGTSTASALSLEGDSTLTNGTTLQLINNFAGAGTESRVISGIRGTGTYLPITVYTGGSQRVKIDTSGNTLVTSAAGLGYGTGAGGTVTQATSKGTAVTLNKPTGQITMNNAALLPTTTVTFLLNNSIIANTDNIILTLVDGSFATLDTYLITSHGIGAAYCWISVKNISAGSLSEALQINFSVIKGATS